MGQLSTGTILTLLSRVLELRNVGLGSGCFRTQECGTGIWMFCSSDVLAEFRCTTHNAKVLIF